MGLFFPVSLNLAVGTLALHRVRSSHGKSGGHRECSQASSPKIRRRGPREFGLDSGDTMSRGLGCCGFIECRGAWWLVLY